MFLIYDPQEFGALKVGIAFLILLSRVKAMPFIETVAGVGRVAEYYILKAGFAHEALRSTEMAWSHSENEPAPVQDRH